MFQIVYSGRHEARGALVARQKEFEPQKALEKATDLFWVRGYEATSVQDLLDCMGIGRGSLYGTFGDKRALFLAALNSYEKARFSSMVAALDAPGSAREAVAEVVERTVEALAGDERRRGCLLANSAVELASHDAEVGRRISDHLRRTEDVLHRALARAQASGEVSRDRDPRALARFLVNNLQGLRLMARAGATKEVMDDVADVMLSALF